MEKKTKQIMIYPINFSNIIGEKKKHLKKQAKNNTTPGFYDFYKNNLSLYEENSLQILNAIYKTLYDLVFESNWKILNINQILSIVTNKLLQTDLWTWDLEKITRDIMEYFIKFQESSKKNISIVKKEMEHNIRPILINAGIYSPFLLETIIRQIINEFEASGNKTSIEEITSRLQQNPILKKLPSNIIDKCVDNFFSILFKKGYISFKEEK